MEDHRDESRTEWMTADGLDRLKQKLAQLEQKLADLRLHKGQEAIYAGDMWHDNPVLYGVEAEERILMREAALTRQKIRNARIIVPAVDEISRVTLGAKVRVRFSDGFEACFTVLGDADSDPSGGIVSHRSPLGQALLGRQVGDKAVYFAGGTFETVDILKITFHTPEDDPQETQAP